MRSEQEMMDIILNFAKENDHVRAVYMNGSRVNPNVQKDKYRDFDVVFVVDDVTVFREDWAWMAAFGEIAVLQEPYLNNVAWGAEHDFSKSYSWQLLFGDWNRLDLTLALQGTELPGYEDDSLAELLLDKDGCLPAIPPANDSGYYIKRPKAAQYDDVTNNFWWCLQNVAKGIVRDQLTYAMNMYGQVVHDTLEKMLNWYIGMDHGFEVALGAWGKYYKKYLSPEMYGRYVKTFADGDYTHLWAAIFTACELFREIAPAVGERLGFVYDRKEDANMTAYLNWMKSEWEKNL